MLTGNSLSFAYSPAINIPFPISKGLHACIVWFHSAQFTKSTYLQSGQPPRNKTLLLSCWCYRMTVNGHQLSCLLLRNIFRFCHTLVRLNVCICVIGPAIHVWPYFELSQLLHYHPHPLHIHKLVLSLLGPPLMF